MAYPMPPRFVMDMLREGQVIPAHPLALTPQRELDWRRQRALTRYYHAAGAGGIAIGVHTTQFEIRHHNLYAPVLKLAADTIGECDAASGRQTVRIAGISGHTAQALNEARLACDNGYHIGLLSLGALRDADDAALLDHCRSVAQEIPVMGFYLQPAVGGRMLSYNFWQQFVGIPNVVAIKIAPFNRYQTLDVIRAVADAGREKEIALYTGNDDNIVVDLLTEYEVETHHGKVHLRMVGGLLGHWACWTRRAIELLDQIKTARRQGVLPAHILTLAAQITDSNAAFFDAANRFAGSIAGILEVLRRQGMLENTLCLNPDEKLSPGQVEEIDRVYRAYTHLNDDEFVGKHLAQWLS